MSSFQRVIKYLAIAFAIFLIVTIASAIVSAGYGLLKATGLLDNTTSSNLDHSKYATYLDINIKYANLKIVSGDTLKVETTNDKINVTQDSNKLYITDKSNVFTKNKDKEVIIYIPDISFDIASINTGYGKVTINDLKANKLDLDLGAGSAKIKNIQSNSTDIDTGTGSVIIDNSILNDAKLDLGIGSIIINADITGSSKINCGIGSVKLNLANTLDNYTISTEKGIGSITINGNKIKESDYTISNGLNHIEIDGGIGSINVNTK